MIASEAQIRGSVARRPFAHSFVSMAGNYLKEALIRKRCLECTVTGGQKCSRCNGSGIVMGGDSTPALEPCRRCIGTGREECRVCHPAPIAAATVFGR